VSNASASGAELARAICDGEALQAEDHLSREQLIVELEQLYRRRARPLANRLGRHGASPDDQMDLVHEAFAKMLVRGAPLHLTTSFPEAYLARISRNLMTDRGRAESVRKQWVDDPAAADMQHHDQVIFLESRDRLRRLEAAVLRLKPKTREVFLARRLDGLSYAEIAERTGLSVRSVERHMSKAIAKLSRLMDRA
jgi:RNA polymerase sigma-70 factor (ECF subfamily)